MAHNIFELEYKQLLMRCLLHGVEKENRTGENCLYLFSQDIKIDLDLGFPLVTSKKMFFDKALHEYLWMFNGDTNIEYLNMHGIKWWNEYADENGDLGPVYGKQIRSFGINENVIDQVNYGEYQIKSNSRRAVVTLWNPNELNKQALPPCYVMFIFSRIDDKLNMEVTLRSSDLFLGLPYDFAVCSLFLYSMAQKCELKPKLINFKLVDAHIYNGHREQVLKYYRRENYVLPTLSGEHPNFKIEKYQHHPLIKAKMYN